MTAILLALVTFVGWGTGDVCAAVASRRVGALKASFYMSVMLVIFLCILAPFMDTSGITRTSTLQSLGLGLVFATGVLAFNSALKIGNPPLIGTISGAFIGVVVIFSLVFLNESINLPQMYSIVLIFLGVTLASLDIRLMMSRSLKLNRSILFALVTLLTWGGYYTFIKIPIEEAGWFWPNFFGALSSMLFFSCIYKIKRRQAGTIPMKRGLFPALGNVLIAGTSNLTYNAALERGNASIVAPIAGSYLVLFVLISAYVFKERLSKQQLIGIFITVCGTVSLSMLSR